LFRVVIISGPDQGNYCELTYGESCLIGRDSANCHLPLSDSNVSRMHARVDISHDGSIVIVDLNSTNGVYVGSGYIKESSILALNEQFSIGASAMQVIPIDEADKVEYKTDSAITRSAYDQKDDTYASSGQASMQHSRTFPLGEKLSIGRDPSNDIVLANPRVSRFHAVIEQKAGRYHVSDLGSTNGIYADGQKVGTDYPLDQGSVIQISGYQFLVEDNWLYEYDETGGHIKIELRNLGKTVELSRHESRIIYEGISLTVEPCEFVAILGGSGTGKSSLMKALMGSWPATEGEILFNGRNFYQYYGAYQSQIGYVPQDDIVHMDLTVEEVLDYAAKLRMPDDTTAEERLNRVNEVIDTLELTARKENLVKTLSGGQRKRVSVGVELLTKPSLFFLDEPTSGFDPGLEKTTMKLLKRLARQGQTIFLVTHATFNIHLCDKVIFLTEGGKLAFYGTPDEALKYFDTSDFAEIYNKIVIEAEPQWWKEQYLYSQFAASYLPYNSPAESYSGAPQDTHVERSSLKQWVTLTSRYALTLFRDRKAFMLLILQPIIIASLCAIVFLHVAPAFQESSYQPEDLLITEEVIASGELFEVLARQSSENTRLSDMLSLLFVMVISAIWLGAFNSAREIVKENNIYKRERLVHLKIAPYLFSKITVQVAACLYQSLIFLAIIWLVLGLPNFWLCVAAFFAIMLASTLMGLTVSSIAATTNSANAAIPILLVPQMLFTGLLMPIDLVEPEFLRPVFYLAISKWGYEILGGDILDVNSLIAFHEAVRAFSGDFLIHWMVLGFFIIAFYFGSTVALIRKDQALS
jgi:ABC transport system ATP-binding/permease protein